jgi:peptidoglycan/LPS O-acetylase OafA/YrhL
MSTPLPRPFSVYLDLVRFLAACLVYLYHSNQRWLVEPLLPLAHHGHSSVIVFFVLSGYVIAYVTDTKERDWVTYTASRLSRVYSVALPAVVLTVVLDWAGRGLLAEPYGYPFDWFAVRIVGSLLMANEVWFVSITSFSNVPYWSICYEAWYYVAFGLLTFLPRRRALALVGALMLLLGPKIAMLAPIWALGVLLYRWRRLAAISERTGWILLLASTAGIALYLHCDIEHRAAAPLQVLLGKHWFEQFAFSRWFIGDYLLGPLVMLHFAGMRRVAGRMSALLLGIEKPVRLLAAYTFTLYLLHQPLFLFWGAVLRGDNRGYGNWLAVTALTALSIAVIGNVTENRRRNLTAWIGARLPGVTTSRTA